MLAWGAPRLRDLPWRRTRDPWLVLVSEVMLQQTQAQRVIPKWQSFCAAYPTPTACAAAPLGDVLRLWQGLGYPRRARDLHRAAVAIEAAHDGEVPADLDALLALPGIGPYTARAVLAFAYERDVGVVDTNIARVLARTSGERLSAAPPSVSPIATCLAGTAGSGTRCSWTTAQSCAARRRSATPVRWLRRAPGIAPDGRTPTRPSDRRVSARGRRRMRVPTVRHVVRSCAP